VSRSLRSAAALSVVGVLILTACNPFAPQASGGQTGSGAGILDHIIQSKQIRVGVVNDNPPFSSVDSSGNMVGRPGFLADHGAVRAGPHRGCQ
jgi:ABC-type amino acid transport substrate-binding protein